jgi:hypothetical protein
MGFSFAGGLEAEFVFDNTISHGLKSVKKVLVSALGDHYTGLKNSQDNFDRLYADLRHYVGVGKGFLAGRLSGGHSFGNSQTNRDGRYGWWFGMSVRKPLQITTTHLTV